MAMGARNEMDLEMNLDSVFIEDFSAEFFAAFDVSQFDEVAARPAFERDCFHGDGKLALLRDHFDDAALPNQGAGDYISASERTARLSNSRH